MDIEFTVRLLVRDAIDPEALRQDYGDDPLRFIRFLTQEEGLQGCAEDDYEILEAHVKEN